MREKDNDRKREKEMERRRRVLESQRPKKKPSLGLVFIMDFYWVIINFTPAF